MYSIIGLGNCGCEITKKFEQFGHYFVKYTDTEERVPERTLLIPEFDHPELYEAYNPDFSSFFEDIGSDLCLVIGGSGKISALSLKLLESVKDRKISVLYIRPDIELLSGDALLIEKTVFNVLQEYARSGLLERVFIVANELMSTLIGDVPITKYYDSINEYLSSIFNMIKVFENSKPLMTKFSKLSDISRIATFGVLDMSTGEEKLLYPFKYIREKRLFFGIPQAELEENGSLLKEITTQTKTLSPDIKTEFAIYSTSYDNSFCYTVNYSSQIQD